jgi:hypothetical protein
LSLATLQISALSCAHCQSVAVRLQTTILEIAHLVALEPFVWS